MTTRAKHILTSNWVAAIIAFLLTSPLWLWGSDRREPVTVLRYELVPGEVHPGDTLYRYIEVVRHQACITDPDVILIDGARTRWRIEEPPVLAVGPLASPDSYRTPMIIPQGAAPGKAEVRVTVTRRCNPVHNMWPLVTMYPPLKFEILPPKEKKNG